MLPDTKTVNRRTIAILLGILLTALAVRLGGLAGLSDSLYFKHLLWDEQMYHQWATAVAAGDPGAGSLYDQAPLPAYLLAAIYTLFSPDPLYFRLANIVFGVATCFFLYLVGKRLGGPAAGLLSCGLAALYGPFILYSIVPLKTSLAICLFSIFMAIVATSPENQPVKTLSVRLFFLGLTLGLAAAVRSNTLILILFIFPYLGYIYRGRSSFKRYLGGLAIFLVGLLLALSPFILKNYSAAGNLSSASSQFGRNLYYGNGPENDTPYYRPMPFASSVPGESSVQFVIEASRRTGRDLSPEESSSFWTQEVIQYIKNHPVSWGKRIQQKIFAVANGFEAGDHYNISFLATQIPFFALPFPGYAFVFALGLAGLFITWTSSRLIRLTAVPFVLYGLSLVIFYVGARYRLPLTVILVPWAAAGTVHFFRYLQEKKFLLITLYLLIVGTSFLLTQLPVKGAGDLTAYYNTQAFLLNAENREKEAIKYWEESVRLDGAFSAPARLFLAGKYYQNGDRERAYQTILGIPDTSFAAFSKYSLLGDLFAYEGKNEAAIEAYENSLSLNAGQRRIRRELINFYFKNEKRKEDAFSQYEDLKRIESFFAD